MDSKKRSITKAISWRIIATTLIGIIAYIFTGAIVSSIELTLTAAIVNTTIYYFHERAWSKIPWGR